MPKGKEYSAKQIQAMRDEGVFSPSEIHEIERSAPLKGPKGLTSDNSTEKREYKYFPDN
tara:strand:- start:398 stop:574 length:177 start_codon:yes stop_codon:yes gene_type:complete